MAGFENKEGDLEPRNAALDAGKGKQTNKEQTASPQSLQRECTCQHHGFGPVQLILNSGLELWENHFVLSHQFVATCYSSNMKCQ